MALAPRAKLRVDMPLDTALQQLCAQLHESPKAVAKDRRSPSMAASGAILMRPASTGSLTPSASPKGLPLGGIWWQKEERRRNGHGRVPDAKQYDIYQKSFAWPTDEEVLRGPDKHLQQLRASSPKSLLQAADEQTLALPDELAESELESTLLDQNVSVQEPPSGEEEGRKSARKSRPTSKESTKSKDQREVVLPPPEIDLDAVGELERATSPDERVVPRHGMQHRLSSFASSERAASSQGNRTPQRRQTAPNGILPATEPGQPEKRVEEPEVKEDISEAILARKLGMPFDMTQEACNLFRKFSNFDETENLLEANLNMDKFIHVLCDLCKVNDVDELEEDFVRSAFKTADRDGGGDIDVHEFAIWYSSFGFSEEMNLTKKDKDLRELARTINVPIVDMERFSRAFKRFDTDDSGTIDYDEFSALLYRLMKVPGGQEIPPDRIKKLWREADLDGSGDLSFAEFCQFYVKRFDQQDGGSFDFSSFYTSVRRVSNVLVYH
mmetsp:Transcript_78525/g.138342  ORF Transcript_78525/g.138342 Transcript_78525/m.138342 type:complete len:498 (+) Transcript_78525:78-1571(+)|eukprot:CAMPEP_0197628334 /NCGR_PEP_ID=MMETSP1338-20131121/6680_1 /TAXON_ID=43686 ORGANISM="Pelagodinium beii, Strain RCC1491" /NCGR_SAMPLE_ID=MMETSP1338 /ASSEMBLY_ACC=CAM_ASM_000754 /LENGTH=497 /DNA_ID=CAMNT_0043199295 /DNA_START=25 /DNA_END=1518 /DNA_ORIENTATION=-